jgi:hypothetical protein
MLFLGPMSKNIVDAAIEFSSTENVNITFIPSRRQIEYCGGYVNNWTTSDFCNYVKTLALERTITSQIQIERDHGGPAQGSFTDNGFESLFEDAKYMDIIHIDPWKKYKSLEEGIRWTVAMIYMCNVINPALRYEIGTEESIRKFEVAELDTFVGSVKDSLSDDIFRKIDYLVIQCGTSLCQRNNTGLFDKDRLNSMLSVAKKYGLKAKEHNGDWVEQTIKQQKLNMGLRYVNIAPELGELETQVVLSVIEPGDFEILFHLCLDSGRWTKWVSPSFDPHKSKKELVLITGHYVFSHPMFVKIKSKYPGIDNLIRTHIYSYLKTLVEIK